MLQDKLHHPLSIDLFLPILYVFVGLAPLILFVTGIVMWRDRYRTKSPTSAKIQTTSKFK